ncbi:hypothetical protein ONS95_009608 [Cadophora gregata]|uniref:uncharacterized protein n=1 Tax=Cadophora gregata TaxID=51156 RepID=UPI0026DB5A19|nr:uncharacterized protein ONS95_009608 [Cadophora gregata]KAK0124662.1 hypothetical protein ONS95_009608 [Cadophora gregata]
MPRRYLRRYGDMVLGVNAALGIQGLLDRVTPSSHDTWFWEAPKGSVLRSKTEYPELVEEYPGGP